MALPSVREGILRRRRPSRFDRRLLRGRALRNLAGGLLLLTIGLGYGTWSTARLAMRGAERTTFDGAVVRFAGSIVRAPDVRPSFRAKTGDEAYLLAVINDQQDILFGLTLLLLRLLIAGTSAGLGLVLSTAGATEWEVRSELARAEPV
ncbi:MAG: hypothetical protein AB7Q29_04945 [Vicinamibacterales bacterium]